MAEDHLERQVLRDLMLETDQRTCDPRMWIPVRRVCRLARLYGNLERETDLAGVEEKSRIRYASLAERLLKDISAPKHVTLQKERNTI